MIIIMKRKVENKSGKAISLKTKLQNLSRFKEEEWPVNIAKALGLSDSTVKTIRDRDGSKIKKIQAAVSISDTKR